MDYYLLRDHLCLLLLFLFLAIYYHYYYNEIAAIPYYYYHVPDGYALLRYLKYTPAVKSSAHWPPYRKEIS